MDGYSSAVRYEGAMSEIRGGTEKADSFAEVNSDSSKRNQFLPKMKKSNLCVTESTCIQNLRQFRTLSYSSLKPFIIDIIGPDIDHISPKNANPPHRDTLPA